MTDRVLAWWADLSTDERRRAHGLGLIAALYLVHFALYSTWFIEDAAITFTFARNAALGEGFVAYAGGEPVEGFSNPSWTLLLTALRLLGISPWIAAKLLGAVLGLATLPLALRWGRRVMGDEAGWWPLLAPLILAVSPQFVLWCASGLENPLFTFLLALGSVMLLREIEQERAPWSGLVFFALAITRPEAPLYAAVAGVIGGVFVLNRRGAAGAWRWAWRWGALLAVPFALFHAVRLAYFAWPFPNTYYAKLAEDEKFQPLQWHVRGWKYVRTWALAKGQGFLLPIYVLGQTGTRGLRGWAGLALSAVVLALIAPGLQWPAEVWSAVPSVQTPMWFDATRVVALATLVVLAPGIGVEREGDAGRVLAWFLGATALFFALYSGGDWMDGFRWINMGVVPLAVLYADGARQVVGALGRLAGLRRITRLATLLLVGTPLVISAVRAGFRIALPETSPWDVQRRVAHMRDIQERLHIDDVTLMEVDIGATMWFSGWEIVDMAGLVDVPMAHHRWEKPFVEQYVYQERRPDFAHVHGGWAGRTRMKTHAEWREYVEVRPYPVSPKLQHVGNHVHQRHFIADDWQGPAGRRTGFYRGIVLEGWDVPAPRVAAGHDLYLEVGWRREGIGDDFRAWVFLSNGERLVSWEIPPAYDWKEPPAWHPRQVMLGRHSLDLPPDLPAGSWDLGLVLMREGPKGAVLPPVEVPVGAVTHDPHMSRAEIRWPDAVEIVPAGEAASLAEASLDAALELAGASECDAAETRWSTGRRHLDRDDPWQARARRRIARPLARCYARWAEALADRPEAVEPMVRARRWDHRDVQVGRVGRVLADAWQAEGDAAWAEGDAERAYAAWRDTLRADPRRTWVRRRAEHARDIALGLASGDDDGSG